MTTMETTRIARERRFFLYMALLIMVTAVAGFGSDIVLYHVWFTDFPWLVHLHAVTFSCWILLYVVQNALVANGRHVALHRRLGWVGAGLAAAMVPLAIGGTLYAVARGSIAGVFPLGFFIAMDVLGILGFAALTLAAILLRNHAGWHKRLMLCGTIVVIGPAFGRLQALLPLGGFAPFAVLVAMLLFIACGISFDALVLRRIHPAYWWGIGVVILLQLLTAPIGFSAPVEAFASRLAGG